MIFKTILNIFLLLSSILLVIYSIHMVVVSSLFFVFLEVENEFGSKADEHLDLDVSTPAYLGLLIAALAAIAATICFIWVCCRCCPISDKIKMILVIAFCILLGLKFATEVGSVSKLKSLRSDIGPGVEKYLINLMLKAGKRDEDTRKNMTYQEFQQLELNTSEISMCKSKECLERRKGSVEALFQLQKVYNCCGVYKPEDYKRVWVDDITLTCDEGAEGCKDKIEKNLDIFALQAMISVGLAMVVQVAGIVLSILLICQLK